jgi:hypothetical protein
VSPAARPPKPLVGWREWVGLPDLGVAAVKAKVDTGARSSSLHAWDVVEEAADTAGVTIVRFRIHPLQDDDEHVVEAAATLVEHRDVRSSNGDVELRPVIRTRVALRGADAYEIELTLARRDEMGFRMLLGRSALKRRFAVDPGRSFLGGGSRLTPPGTKVEPESTP